MSRYAAFTFNEILTLLQYRASAVGLIVGVLLLVGLQFALWHAVFQTAQPTSLSLDQTLLYVAISRVWWQIVPTNSSAQYIARRVRDGTVAIDLVRPANLVWTTLARELGRGVVRSLLVGVPTVAIIVLLLRPAYAANQLPAAALMFAFGYLIAFNLSALIGLLSLLTTSVTGLLEFRDGLVTLLGGALVPLSFYPDLLRQVAEASPFIYIYYRPLSVLVGESSLDPRYLVEAGFWVVALVALNQWILQRVSREVVIQGG